MNVITKVSEITNTDVADYIRLDEVSAEDYRTIDNLLMIAKAYIQNYTGQEDLDNFPDFVIVVLILCQDMWDNRTMYVNSANLSHVVETILGMHQVNLL